MVMKRAIVTGPSGTIGHALVNELINNGIDVIAVVRPGSKRARSLPVSEHLQLVELDISNIIELPNLLGSSSLYKKIDAFYNLGWIGSGRDDRNNTELQKRNIQYELEAVEVAKQLGCEVFIGAGSQAEYGHVEGKIGPTVATKPVLAYGDAKLSAGILSREKCNQYGIRHIWTRIFSVYGPYMGMDSLITSSIHDMANGKAPKTTKGEQIWDFMYVDDAAKVLVSLGKRGKDGKIYCIGSGEGRPVREYLQDIRDVICPELELIFGEVPYSSNQIMELVADTDELIEDTGVVPEVSFKEGILRTYKWMQSEKMV